MSYGTVLLSELYKSGNFGQANTPVNQLHFTFISISKKLYLQTKINREALFYFIDN